MKRIIALLLSMVSLSSVFFSGCSAEPRYPLNMVQWLGMINQAFGMDTYTTEVPFFDNITVDDDFFGTVQIAAEWDIIDSDKNFNPDAEVYWQDVLVTLVNAGNFVSENATDEEKIQYAIDNFDKKIRRYWMNRKIDVTKANDLLVVAQDMWANREYKERIEKIDYTENVKDLTAENIEFISVDENNGTIVLDAESVAGIQQGDIFVVSKGEGKEDKAYKAEDITIENGFATVKTQQEELELGDIVDELYVQETVYPDLSVAEIYDGNGNLVSGNNASQLSMPDNKIKVEPLAFYNKDYDVKQTAAKTSFEFETKSCKVKANVMSDGISAEIEFPLSKKNESLKGKVEVEISNFKVTHKIDYSWFTLHSAEVKVDYTTKVAFAAEKEYVDEKRVYAPKWSNGNGKFLTNLKNSMWKDDDAAGAKTIKIGSIKVASVGVASFSIDVNATLKVDGSIEISMTQVGAKGVEYKNGKCRVINTNNKDVDVKIQCKIEGIFSVGPTVNAFGFAIIGISAQVGLGASASVTVHLSDPERHLLEKMQDSALPPGACQSVTPTGLTADADAIKELAESQGGIYNGVGDIALNIDNCIDIAVYFIFRIGISEETLAGKLLKGTKVKISWEICGSKNAKLVNFHVENFDFISAFQNIKFFNSDSQCTLKFEPFDGTSEEETTIIDEENATSTFGEVLTISDMKVVLNIDQQKIISVVQIPKGYELKDVVCESENKKVATIDKNGVIKGVGEGSTTIIVSTVDGKFSCACSVTVTTEESSSFKPLSSINNIEVKGLAIA